MGSNQFMANRVGKKKLEQRCRKAKGAKKSEVTKKNRRKQLLFFEIRQKGSFESHISVGKLRV